ncbi:MAG: M23 family metallopeptidase [Mailhella sp.]|nr:M23 family metallopeptidase [Mailhella sp.]
MTKKLILLLFLLVCPGFPCLGAPSWDIPGKVSQGRAFEVRITDAAPFRGNILWNGASYPVPSSPAGGAHEARILLAMPIDAAKPIRAVADLSSGSIAASVTPVPVNWPRQILSVAPKYVSPPPKVLKRIERDRKLSRSAIATVTERGYWGLPLNRPVPGTVSSVFGGRRVFNGQPRSPHLGTDLRGKAGTPVESVAAGTVIAAADLYFSGNTVYIDHGQGVISMYCHLSSIGVREGEFVGRGQVIGKVGATGRVTGPHLHSALYVGRVPVDILPLFDPLPSPVGGPSKEQPRN